MVFAVDMRKRFREVGMIQGQLRNAMRHVLLLAIVTLMLQAWGAGSAKADEAGRIRDLERRLEENSRLMEKLAERVRELENKATRGHSEAESAVKALPEQQKQEAKTAATSGSYQTFLDDVTWLHGFADAGLTYSGRRQGEGSGRKGFSIGALDLYLTPQLGTHFKSLVELIFEINDEGETVAELERLQIGYAFSDSLSLWAGRYHTPLGYWNTAFHHGKQLQTTIQRPKFLDFEEESGILPTHMTGLWGTGVARTGGGKLGYDLYIANGPKVGGSGKLDPNPFSDDNHGLAVGLHVSYDFTGALDGLRLGLHALRTDADTYNSGVRISRSELNLLGGYGVYTADDWEVIGEFYQFLNRDRSGGSGTHGSTLGFLQAGRLIGRFTPYTRFEFASLDQGDSYFSKLQEGQSYRRILTGIRYDLTPKAALKLEGNHTRIMNRDRDDYFEISSQFSIRF